MHFIVAVENAENIFCNLCVIILRKARPGREVWLHTQWNGIQSWAHCSMAKHPPDTRFSPSSEVSVSEVSKEKSVWSDSWELCVATGTGYNSWCRILQHHRQSSHSAVQWIFEDTL